MGSSAATCGIHFPKEGSELGPLHWKLGVLDAGPPGYSSMIWFSFRKHCAVRILHGKQTHIIDQVWTFLLGTGWKTYTSAHLVFPLACLEEGNGTPLQCTCQETPMDGGAWWAAVHGVKKSRTRLSDFTFTFHFHALEKEMATHSSVLAWRIPGTGEPGGLPSMGSHRVGHDWSDLTAAEAAAIMPNSPLSVPLHSRTQSSVKQRWETTDFVL